MTPAQFSPIVRKELQGLSRPAKNSLLALIRDRMNVFTGTNARESRDERIPALARSYAMQRNRAAELFLADLEEILGVDHNGPLGAISEELKG